VIAAPCCAKLKLSAKCYRERNPDWRSRVSYVLCIWDPSRYPTLPTSRDEGIEISKRLAATLDAANARFSDFAVLLVGRYDKDVQAWKDYASVDAFWGGDPRLTVSACRSAVLRLEIPADECVRQISFAVEAAAELGLVVMDDEIGMSYLPDGRIFPEEDREMWEWNVADMRARDANPDLGKQDGKSFLEKAGSDLLDVLSLGNKRL
jgi:hypothetical protein